MVQGFMNAFPSCNYYFSHNVAALGYVRADLHNISTFRIIFSINHELFFLAVFTKASIATIIAHSEELFFEQPPNHLNAGV